MFKIFYGNGATYKAHDGGRPPARDVQVILQEDENGPYFQSGSDYYVLVDDRWLGVDEFGLFDFLLDSDFYRYENLHHWLLIESSWIEMKNRMEFYFHLMDTGLVLFGRTITNKEYQAIYQRAKVDKSTWRPTERKP